MMSAKVFYFCTPPHCYCHSSAECVPFVCFFWDIICTSPPSREADLSLGTISSSDRRFLIRGEPLKMGSGCNGHEAGSQAEGGAAAYETEKDRSKNDTCFSYVLFLEQEDLEQSLLSDKRVTFEREGQL